MRTIIADNGKGSFANHTRVAGRDAQQLAQGQDLSRAALEALVAESCREHRLSDHQAAQILGLSRHELDGFLKARGVFYDYTIEDLKQENEVAEKLWQKRQAEIAAKRDSQNQ